MMSEGRNVASHEVSIAERVLGVVDLSDPDAALTTAYAVLTGQELDGEELDALTNTAHEAVRNLDARMDLELYQLPPETVRTFAVTKALSALFKEHNPHANASAFSRWPQYAEHYKRFASDRHVPPDSPKRALLLGSLSALSSKAFGALAEDVYGVAPGDAHIIDPLGGADRKHCCPFVVGNGFALPYKDQSMHVVQTVMLMHMLLGEQGDVLGEKFSSERNRSLFRQVYDVLEPGGYLLMQELPPGFDWSDKECNGEANQELVKSFKSSLQLALKVAGFIIDVIEQSWLMPRAFFFDPERRTDRYERTSVARSFAICAHKPA